MTYRHTIDLDDAFFPRLEEIADELIARLLLRGADRSRFVLSARRRREQAHRLLLRYPRLPASMALARQRVEGTTLTGIEMLCAPN